MLDIILIFILGLIVGSFLNCVIYRMSKGESFVSGHSYCPKCKHNLYFWDLFPLFSYIFLGGKCRYCKAPISCQYPLVEGGTALLFMAIYLFCGGLPVLFSYAFFKIIFWWIIVSFLVIVFVFDFKYYLIPDEVTYSAIAVSFVWLACSFFTGHLSGPFIFFSLLSAFGASLFFFLLWFFSKGKAMGFGDVKLAFLMGLLLGWPGTLLALFLSFFLGAIIGLMMVGAKRKGMRSEIPFGPFIVVAIMITVFYGQEIINWYLSFL